MDAGRILAVAEHRNHGIELTRHRLLARRLLRAASSHERVGDAGALNLRNRVTFEEESSWFVRGLKQGHGVDKQ